MSFRQWKNLWGERRSQLSLPPPDSLTTAILSNKTSSGINVTEGNSLRFSPVWGALRGLVNDIAKLELKVFDVDGPRREEDTTSSLSELLTVAPNDFMTPFQFIASLMVGHFLYGNGFAWVRRNVAGNPTELLPLDPARTQIDILSTEGDFFYRTSFEGSQDGSVEFAIDRSDVIHVRGIGLNGIEGWPVVQNAKESLGFGMALQQHANRFFSQGAQSNVAFVHPGELEGDAAEALRRGIESRLTGHKNAWRPWVLEEDMKVVQLSQANDSAQVAELMEQAIRDASNWWNYPSHRLGDTAKTSFSSLEEENRAYHENAIDPVLCNTEQELRKKLVRRRRARTKDIRFDRSGLRFASVDTQGEFYSKMFQVGVFSSNEIRRKFGENPIADGDEYYVPQNLRPAGEEPEPPARSAPPEPPGGEEENDEAEDLRTRYRELLHAALEGLVARVADQARAAAKVSTAEYGEFLDLLVTKNDAYLARRIPDQDLRADIWACVVEHFERPTEGTEKGLSARVEKCIAHSELSIPSFAETIK